MVKSVFNIEAPRSQVFQVLTDYAGYVHWMPGCEQARVLSASGNTAEAEIVINGMKKMKLMLHFETQPTQGLNFRMVGGKDIKAYVGAYRLMDSADGNGTVLITEVGIDAGAMVPQFMVDRMAKKSLADSANAINQYLKKNPPSAAQASAGATAAMVKAKRGRAKRILQVVKTPDGYRLWIKGNTHIIKVS